LATGPQCIAIISKLVLLVKCCHFRASDSALSLTIRVISANIVLHCIMLENVIALLLLWPPYVIGQAIIFLPCGFFYLSYIFYFLFSSHNLSGRRLDLYHTSTHGVAIVRI